jgi:hypothetical protein
VFIDDYRIHDGEGRALQSTPDHWSHQITSSVKFSDNKPAILHRWLCMMPIVTHMRLFLKTARALLIADPSAYSHDTFMH